MSQVSLYVYDLSNGLARQMSLQLTGKHIEGIWHTSIVVFGMEVFYGQGICITSPGMSHHGSPLHVLNMGETGIDKETFEDYLGDIKDHYTADKYHLLDFNCNSFTNDCIGFLTGGAIPSWITELPQEFLSTPLGAALRPTIDAMFRRPSAGAPATLSPSAGTSLLHSIASRASGEPQAPSIASASTSTLASPLQISTNPASFNTIISSHRCVSVFFTSSTCAPCSLIAPTFEDLAWKHAKSNVVSFIKVDIGVGLGGQIAQRWNVRATPTFTFFLDGKKTGEFKGVNKSELQTQVQLLIYQAFPPHPHTKTKFFGIQSLSLDPILFKQPPAWDMAAGKLISFVDAVPIDSSTSQALSDSKHSLLNVVIPYLKSRFPKNIPGLTPKTMAPSPDIPYYLSQVTNTFLHHLSINDLFPLVDIWRMAVLDKALAVALVSQLTPKGEILSGNDTSEILLIEILSKANGGPNSNGITSTTGTSSNNRNTLLTTLRLLSNAFSYQEGTGKYLLSSTSPSGRASPRSLLTTTLVSTLLHTDNAVRTAAASLAFNIASCIQKTRRNTTAINRESNKDDSVAEDTDWEIEIISALVEAIKLENSNEDIVYRLIASLALLLYISPNWTTSLCDFVQVLDITVVLEAKISEGVVQKNEVVKLIRDVVEICRPAAD